MDIAQANEIIKGLSSQPKYISSKYFYDDNGSKLFQIIMSLPEYYLTGTEYDILENSRHDFLELFSDGTSDFNLIELGAGDGYKTKILLRHFIDEGSNFKYIPIDISREALDVLTNDLKAKIPGLSMDPMQNEYFEALKLLREQGSDSKNIVLFLGSNIGNFTEGQCLDFLAEINRTLNIGDLLVIGFDLKKDPVKILNAYNDSSGITRAFNLNLLIRFNREMGANFDITGFSHYPTYDPSTGQAKSFLISNADQEVIFSKPEAVIRFNKSEYIFTEVSQKYDLEQIQTLALKSGYEIIENFYDRRKYFTNSVWRVKEHLG